MTVEMKTSSGMLTLLICSFTIQAVCSLELFVMQQRGICEQPCFQGDKSLDIHCCSIEHVASNYQTYNTSSITVHLFGQIQISGSVTFENITYLEILSTDPTSNSSVICNISNENVGLEFINVQSLRIYGISIVSCGASRHYSNELHIITAMAIVYCECVLLEEMSIKLSRNTSLLIKDTLGNVTLEKVKILSNIHFDNEVIASESFTGGIQIIVNNNFTMYKIIDSLFEDIATPNYTEFDPRKVDGIKGWLGFGLGGALSIIFEEYAVNNVVWLNNLTVLNCSSPFGGCMYVRYQDSSSNNSVVVINSNFQECEARFGGGGLAVGVAKKAVYNSLVMEKSEFLKNSALFGGGTYLFSFYNRDNSIQTNSLEFISCNWTENRGTYSSAVDLSPSRYDHHGSGNLPNPIFQDCKFFRNSIKVSNIHNSRLMTSGVFVITRMTIKFHESLLFDNNSYTALLLNSARIELGERTEIRFHNNTGFYGGAVALHGFSSLSISDHCNILFTNNSATEYGGAIFYHTTEQREFLASRSCFLEYSGLRTNSVKDRNITIQFSGNVAKLGGSSIFASTLFSCYYSNRDKLGDSDNLKDFLDDIGNVSGLDIAVDNDMTVLSTLAYMFRNSNENKTLSAWPGELLKLPLSVTDELYANLTSEFYTRILKDNTSISIQYPYTVDRSVTLFGAQGDQAVLIVSTQSLYRIVQYVLKVELLHCPPGFYYDNSSKSCKCSTDNQQKAYSGIVKCKQHTAMIKRGYWAGYYNRTGTFYTAPCPLFCNSSNLTAAMIALPDRYDLELLNLLICGETRYGELCGQCMNGFSTYFHSNEFTCGEESKCSYGAIFYVLSELAPVFVFFTLSILFEVNFSSGASNGFIFYCQIVTIIPPKYTTMEHSNGVINTLTIGYNLVYGIFNFEFFSVDLMSFCLFRGATVMNILVFRYITIVFAFFLVIFLILSVRYCTCCSMVCTKMKSVNVSVLHGLSGFLIISYAECVRVSLFILRKSNLRGAGGDPGPSLAYYGGLSYMEGEHLLYALLAILVLFIIGFIPCLLLLLYPSLLHLLQMCKLSENTIVLGILRLTRVNKLKPMFDVFQGGFKDKCRLFAGLYLFYRIVILVPYSFSNSALTFGLTSQFFLVLMLSVHSVFHPYKQLRHNMYDSLLLSNLILINSFGILLLASEFSQPIGLLEMSIYIQLLLIYLPLIVVVVFLLVKLYRAVKKLCRKSIVTADLGDNDHILDYLDWRQHIELQSNN